MTAVSPVLCHVKFVTCGNESAVLSVGMPPTLLMALTRRLPDAPFQRWRT